MTVFSVFESLFKLCVLQNSPCSLLDESGAVRVWEKVGQVDSAAVFSFPIDRGASI